jgi:integrase
MLKRLGPGQAKGHTNLRSVTDSPDSEFVFTAPEGGLFLYSWRSRFWTPAVRRSQLGHITPHELRHTAAALWIDQGGNPVTVQRCLGHKDVRTTLQLYGHLFPEQDDLLTERMEHLYRQSAAAPPRPDDTIDVDNVSGESL